MVNKMELTKLEREYCPNCGSIVEDDKCSECGEQITRSASNPPVVTKVSKSNIFDAWINSLSVMQKIVLVLWILFWGAIFYYTYEGYIKIILGA